MIKKIMIVDDDPDIITSIKVGLNVLTNKYEITSANTGKECIDLLKNEEVANPDLILLDIMMPDINGWDILDLIRNNRIWKDIPIVFITALDDEETIEKGIKTNSYCIRKPFRIEELKETIDKVLEGDRIKDKIF